MTNQIKLKLHEALSQSDKSEIEKIVKKSMSSKDLEKAVSQIIRNEIKKNKELEDKVVDITKNVLTQLYKTLWAKRNFWQTGLKNKES